MHGLRCLLEQSGWDRINNIDLIKNSVNCESIQVYPITLEPKKNEIFLIIYNIILRENRANKRSKYHIILFYNKSRVT